jgi:hypothetical protein
MEAGVLNNPHPTTDVQNPPVQHGNLGVAKQGNIEVIAQTFRQYRIKILTPPANNW